MSDNKAFLNLPGLGATTGEKLQHSTVVLDKDQPISFTYPEGFNAVANSLQFLPEEARVQILSGLVVGMLFH
jgi:hypothetical protein